MGRLLNYFLSHHSIILADISVAYLQFIINQKIDFLLSSVSFFPAHLIKPASQAALPASFFSYPLLSLKPVNKPSHLPLPSIFDSLHLCIFVTDSTLTHHVSIKKACSRPLFFCVSFIHSTHHPSETPYFAGFQKTQ